MHEYYADIRSRIAEEPAWFDQNGVPRYGDFSPDKCPNIYADTVVLLEIACQDCWQRFKVEMHSDFFRPLGQPRELHYGDPPAHGCVGDSMNCEDLRVLEVWNRENKNREWTRHPELEGPIDEEA